ncbi:hypothetical protein HRbin41_01491 [bacterium HR41]|nr:hypothetical protein HRbin41_01491 [bacterium HR41]
MQIEGCESCGPEDAGLVGALLDRGSDDARRADAVRAHHDRTLSALFVEEGRAERLGVARAELEDVAHLDRRFDANRAATRTAVAGFDTTDVRPLAVEVAPGLDPHQVGVGFVGAGHEPAQAAQRLVGDERTAESDRADVARRHMQLTLDLFGGELAHLLAEVVAQFHLVETVVAAHERDEHTARLGAHRQRFNERGGRDCEKRRNFLDCPLARGVDLLGSLTGCGQVAGRSWRAARDLDVRGVAGIGERDLVLARWARRHVLVRTRTAHHPHIRLDFVPLEAGAVEDARVGAAVELVGALEPLSVAIEAVGVLHHELAHAQKPRARAGLVASLQLELVEDQRQLAVGAHLARHVPGNGLFVRHRQN